MLTFLTSQLVGPNVIEQELLADPNMWEEELLAGPNVREEELLADPNLREEELFADPNVREEELLAGPNHVGNMEIQVGLVNNFHLDKRHQIVLIFFANVPHLSAHQPQREGGGAARRPQPEGGGGALRFGGRRGSPRGQSQYTQLS